jgi:arylmalonate decarboxylase
MLNFKLSCAPLSPMNPHRPQPRPAGLIVPPARPSVPPDAEAMYPGFPFIAEGLGLAELSVAAYAAAIGRAGECAAALAAAGAGSAFMFGTSLSFFSGPEGNRRVVDAMAQASGLPCETLTGALSASLRTLGVRRFAAVTAYTAEVDALFRRYFEGEGFEIAALAGMGMAALSDVEAAGTSGIERLSETVLAEAPGVDALVIACAGLRTAAIAPALEQRFGLPVVSSPMVGAHAAVRLAGEDPRVERYGRFYAAG